MDIEERLILARQYVEDKIGIKTIGSFRVDSPDPKKSIVGVTASADRVFRVVFIVEFDEVRLYELHDRGFLSELREKIRHK